MRLPSKILVTGAAGFIGAKVSERLLAKGCDVVGLDDLNAYYDVRLKQYRLSRLKPNKNFSFYKGSVENHRYLKSVFKKIKPEAVVHLAARAGVRYSLENPFVYEQTNVLGTLNVLDLCREFDVPKFILASTSALYAGQKMPFKESLALNRPISPYAATKKAAEAMSYTYHHLYDIDVTILRYFTVYGPAGRPDMSYFAFARAIDEGRALQLFGDGTQSRDFTYVDDIAEGTIRALRLNGYNALNLGGSKPYSILAMIQFLEKFFQKKAEIKEKPFQKADLKATWADISLANRLLNWKPTVTLEEGLRRFVEWYLENRAWLKKLDR